MKIVKTCMAMLVFVFLSLCCIAQEPEVKVELKLDSIILPKMPEPKVPVNPTLDFHTGQVCIISSTTDVIPRFHPDGVVTVTKRKYTNGITISGVFIDGNGQTEEREYPGPWIITVKPTGKGLVEGDIIPVGVKKEKEIAFIRLNVNQFPNPPNPDPVPPDPKPIPPDPKPVPIVYPDAWFIVVEDLNNRTPEIALTLDFRQWDATGANYRFYSKNSPDAKKYKFDVMAEQEVAKGRKYPVLLAVKNDGALIESNTLPPNFAGVRDIIKRVSGK